MMRCYEPDRELREMDRTILCNRCLHKRMGGTCAAFPNGIPMEILRSGEHFTSVPGDNGIVYKPVSSKPSKSNN